MLDLSLGVPCPPNLDTETYLASLYKQLTDDFVSSDLRWPNGNLRLSFRRNPLVNNLPKWFWHIVSEGPQGIPEENRQVDFARCQRVHWIRPMFEEFCSTFPSNSTLRWWISSRSTPRTNRYLISLPDYSYVIIFDQKPSYALLVTAYPVEQKHRRKKLEKEYSEYWQKQGPPEQRTAPDTPSTHGR